MRAWCLALLVLAGAAPGGLSAQEEGTPGAAALEAQGDRALARGDVAGAIELWADAIERAGPTEAVEEARLRAKRAEAMMRLGRYDRAIADLEEAVTASAAAGDAALEARLQGSLGTARFLSGHPGAREAFDACIAAASVSGDRPLEARGLNGLGLVHEGLGESGQALERFEAGWRLATSAGDGESAAAARLNAARVRLAAGDPAGALDDIEQAASAYLALPDSPRKAAGLGSAAALWFDEAPDDGAGPAVVERALDESDRIARTFDDARALSVAVGYRGALARRAGRTEEALEGFREARRLARRAGAPEIAYRWDWALGKAHAAGGDRAAALESYRAARATLIGLRRELVGALGPVRERFDEDVAAVHLELVELLLATAADAPGEPAREALLVEARETVELRKAVELESYYRDDCVAALRATARSVDEISSRAAALYPLFLRERLTLLLSTPAGMERVDVEVPLSELEATIEEFRDLVGHERTRRYVRPAGQLYEWLVRPLEPTLAAQGIDTIVLVPDGPLRTVPLAALYDARTGEHLIQRYALVVAPGVRLLDPRPLGRARASFLIAGLSEGVQGFAPLPHVDTELDSIEALYGGEVYRGPAFRTASVEAALDAKPFTVVHLATHAEFGADARSSFLLTYDGRMGVDSLERFVKYGRFRTEPVELLTLSACETAAGDERAALGLAGIAIKAGARSAMATLWQVDDQAAAILVAQFYEALRDPTITKAEALRRAQRTLIEDPEFRHRYRYPMYWAPFTLIGNWL